MPQYGVAAFAKGMAMTCKLRLVLAHLMTSDNLAKYRTLHQIPMGLCFPGTGKSGDLPPMKISAPQWHPPLLHAMPNIRLTLLIGQYAIQRYLADKPSSVTAAVQAQTMLPHTLVLPHPSPRNNIWQRKNPWFMNDILPQLKSLTEHALE